MAVRFDCPHCKANYEVADDLAGKTIMCRVCQKRGQVRSASGTVPTPAAGSTAAISLASAQQSRRKFLMIGAFSAASLVSIVAGAILARRPWQARGDQADDRRRGGPPGGPPRDRRDEKDGKDGKDDKKGPQS